MCFTCFSGLDSHNTPVSQWCIKDRAVGLVLSETILTLMKIPLLFIKTVAQQILTASERKYLSLKTKSLVLIKVLNNDYDHWWTSFTYVYVSFKLAMAYPFLNTVFYTEVGSENSVIQSAPDPAVLYKKIPRLRVVCTLLQVQPWLQSWDIMYEHINSRFWINHDSTVVIKVKRQNLRYFSSVALCGHLEFLIRV